MYIAPFLILPFFSKIRILTARVYFCFEHFGGKGTEGNPEKHIFELLPLSLSLTISHRRGFIASLVKHFASSLYLPRSFRYLRFGS